MFKLESSCAAWGSPEFGEAFQSEVAQLRHEQLPLQQGLERSSYVSDEPFRVVVLVQDGDEQTIRVKAGIFYSGIIAGCNCSDDPTPPDVQIEYCEVEFSIDRQSGDCRVSLL